MSLGQEGLALVCIYCNGQRQSVLTHDTDGGEAYMGPVLRRGVAYARTHYESGNIRDVLMSEPEMREFVSSKLGTDILNRVRHVYYVEVDYDVDAARKNYAVRAVHVRKGEKADNSLFPFFADGIPENAKKLI